MDPQIIAMLTPLDQTINGLAVNAQLPLDRIKDIQNKRSNLDRKVTSFREDTERRNTRFMQQMNREIQSLYKKIERINS